MLNERDPPASEQVVAGGIYICRREYTIFTRPHHVDFRRLSQHFLYVSGLVTRKLPHIPAVRFNDQIDRPRIAVDRFQFDRLDVGLEFLEKGLPVSEVAIFAYALKKVEHRVIQTRVTSTIEA